MPARSRPDVVLFDLDDTLFDHASATRAALTGVHTAQTCFAVRDFTAFEAEHAQFLEQLHQRVISGEIGIDAARIERFRRLFAAAGVTADDELLHETAMQYRRAYLEARAPMRGAADLLAALKPRVRIGIVSNNLLDEQQEKLRMCGFAPYVDALIVSEEAGMSKPDPAIFAIALDRLAAKAADAVMVGDSWSADIEGAQAAGIFPIWFNPFGRPRPQAGIAVLETFIPVAAAIEVILGPTLAGPGGGHAAIKCSA